MKISIVIPNYNGEDLIRKNLPKVIEAAEFYFRKTNEDVEIIIVDDASTDESVTTFNNLQLTLRPRSGRAFNNLKLLQNEKNLGFSSAVNKGVREATGEIIVLLNTDVTPEKDFLLPLMVHFEEKAVAAVGCMDKSIEGKSEVLRGRGIGTWKRGLLVHKRGEINSTDTLWVSGGSCAIRKSVWNLLGGFNPLYNPFYWEDIDFSYRCLKSGYRVLFEPNSIVVHKHESGAIKAKYSPRDIKIISYRNQFIFSWMNITDFPLILSHLIWLPYHIGKAIITVDSVALAGFLRAIIKLNTIMQTREKNKKLFIKSDMEVIDTIKNA